MFQVNGSYFITVNGVQQFGAANPGAGIANGTEITASWLNDVQGELLNFLTAASIVPAANTPTQVKESTDFLYALKFNVLSAPKIIEGADRGTVFVCDPGTTTVTLPAADGFDAGFLIGLSGSTITQVSVTDILNDGGALRGLSGFTLNVGSFVLLQAQGLNWGVISASPDLQAGSARPQYIATQAGSITPALGSKNAICSQVITFPNYSPSGAFRVLIRTLAQGDSSGTGQNQNFTSIVFDGTNTLTGAPWLIAAVNNGVNTWGTSDTFLSSATYAPGATVTFAYSINAAGGSTDFTITGSSMIITVEPA